MRLKARLSVQHAQILDAKANEGRNRNVGRTAGRIRSGVVQIRFEEPDDTEELLRPQPGEPDRGSPRRGEPLLPIAAHQRYLGREVCLDRFLRELNLGGLQRRPGLARRAVVEVDEHRTLALVEHREGDVEHRLLLRSIVRMTER